NASMNRSVRASSSRSGWPNGGRLESDIVASRSYNLGFQPRQCPMLGYSHRSGGAADGIGSLLSAQTDHHAQDQDLTLLFRQNPEQFVHPGDGVGFDGHLLGTCFG